MTTSPRRTSIGRQSAARRAAAASFAGASVVLLLAACGNDPQSATPATTTASEPASQSAGADGASTGPLTVDKPAPDLDGTANCPAAVRVHNNKHNICATWTNDAPAFTGPGVLSNAPTNFKVAGFDANGTSTHHVSQMPAAFGPSTWGATSAATGYGASMAWSFTSAQPQDTISGSATQDSDDGHTADCGASVGQFLLCTKTSSAMSQIDGDRVHIVGYSIVNAPLTVQVVNNTGEAMTSTGKPALDRVQSSPAGSANTTTVNAKQSAYFGLYRAANQSATFRAEFSFADGGNPKITHKVAVTAQAKLVNPDEPDVASRRMDTSGSSCVDNPSSGSAAKATCEIVWTGNTSWFGSAAMTVYVSNSS